MNNFLLETIPAAIDMNKLDQFLDKLIDISMNAGRNIISAILVYFIGSFLIRLVNRFIQGVLERRKVDVGVQSFLKSSLNITLRILLIVAVIGALGVNTTTFAALLASAGVAIGMALSGNLQNFAGGLIILLFKPYRVGDLIEAQGILGNVREIQIFHTILTTYDNKVVYIPNGTLSTSTIVNHTREATRRIEWTVGVEYGEDINKVREKLLMLFQTDSRILQAPDKMKPFVGLGALADSSVNLTIRVWVNNDDYWPVYYQMQQRIYELFTQEGINIPFPQTVVHLEK